MAINYEAKDLDELKKGLELENKMSDDHRLFLEERQLCKCYFCYREIDLDKNKYEIICDRTGAGRLVVTCSNCDSKVKKSI